MFVVTVVYSAKGNVGGKRGVLWF